MFARASIEVTSILADHWAIESGSFATSTTYLPFLLSFSKVHHLALRFFLRMWNESGPLHLTFRASQRWCAARWTRHLASKTRQAERGPKSKTPSCIPSTAPCAIDR